MLEFLQSIPSWVGGLIGAMIGFIAKTAWDAWKEKKLPYKQDHERYNYIIESVSPVMLGYFTHTEIPRNMSHQVLLDNLYSTSDIVLKVAYLHKPYINQRLNKLEVELCNSLSALENVFFKIDCPDSPILENNEAVRRGSALQAAYENYRDYGNKLFAQKIR
jgi:hypothetical protein